MGKIPRGVMGNSRQQRNMQNTVKAILIVLSLFVLGCQGERGPTGPEGGYYLGVESWHLMTKERVGLGMTIIPLGSESRALNCSPLIKDTLWEKYGKFLLVKETVRYTG